jgi:hypothetical protein
VQIVHFGVLPVEQRQAPLLVKHADTLLEAIEGKIAELKLAAQIVLIERQRFVSIRTMARRCSRRRAFPG